MPDDTEGVAVAHRPDLEMSPVNVRIKLSALWAATLFVFAYVDLFSLYRPDVRADLAAGTLGGFAVGPSFLMAATVYILVPAAMVFAVLVARPAVNRVANLVLSAAYAMTIAASAIGEWSYYVVGSAVEVALLAGIGFYAWTWPRGGSPSPTQARALRRSRAPVAS